MFTDWQQALDAEALPLHPNPAQQLAAAARVTARHSRDKDDTALLLDVLGLPTDTDTLTALLPLLPETGDAPTMTTTNAPAPAIDIPVTTLPVSAEAQELLDWAATHPAAGVRSRATRITADLSELSARRESEAVQREAETRVAQLKAELEQAQETLRTVKAGTRAPAPSTANVPAPLSAQGRKAHLAAVRAWARANGHQVADRGNPPKAVLDAYAAHQPAHLIRAV
ncbi:histone-like nucleoid-structuring protein Lsr2 [Streptomyces sp. NPDC014894]|uniref:Lsr2 family DNA-binding protein n=1 Tax=Streptomyces sp. NPDC014894 TaxID=3364931 RepID=UPI0036FCB684